MCEVAVNSKRRPCALSLIAALLVASACGPVPWSEPDSRGGGRPVALVHQAVVESAGLPPPVAAWSFDNCSYTSSRIDDAMSSVSDGVWSGKIGCGYRSPSGSAGRFTGQGKVEAADQPAFHFTTALTVSALVKPSRVDLSQTLVNKWYGFDSYGLAIRGGRYHFDIALPGGTWGQSYSVSSPATAGAWAHVAGTFDGQTMTLYLNGQPMARASVIGSLQDSSRPISIGDNPAGSGFHGLIDDVRLFNVALDGTQMKRLASALYGIPLAAAL
jgi:hypothetical protein